VRADEPGTAGYHDPHQLTCSLMKENYCLWGVRLIIVRLVTIAELDIW
jgi:hypothetical protein